MPCPYDRQRKGEITISDHSTFRKAATDLMPAHRAFDPGGRYDIYPAHPLGPGRIAAGFDALAARLAAHRVVTLDGFAGMLWGDFRARLDTALRARGVAARWVNVDSALRSAAEIDALTAPFLGGDDPLFGTRFTGDLRDFFDPAKLAALHPDGAAALNIIYGCGAALAAWDGPLFYADVPKSELQFRARAGAVANLGLPAALPPKPAYKRSYFVDWPALNRQRAALLPRLDWMVDAQRPDTPLLLAGDALRAALEELGQNVFRVRPWFEPGPWGGQWMKAHIPGLPQDAPNFAWSFEMIAPEQGLIFESDGCLLEAAFDWLMIQAGEHVLGAYARYFGGQFPIRFDFLDTFDGGNLSVQCHPRPAYIREHFGERFTQDETYYILDCAPGAEVYLGFQAGVDPDEFRAALETSFNEAAEVDIPRFVQRHPAQRHDLFLIPNGTIHCSGQHNLVLEISATPYIFTFKLYDWLRLDLDGKPRPLNIARAFDNLDFARQGGTVPQQLLSHPYVLAEGDGWRLIHQPTHAAHFYDVHRCEFSGAVAIETQGSPHILMLVEGEAVAVETARGVRARYHYAETFVIPAAAEHYRLINTGSGTISVVKAFLKPEWFAREQNQWLQAQP